MYAARLAQKRTEHFNVAIDIELGNFKQNVAKVVQNQNGNANTIVAGEATSQQKRVQFRKKVARLEMQKNAPNAVGKRHQQRSGNVVDEHFPKVAPPAVQIISF